MEKRFLTIGLQLSFAFVVVQNNVFRESRTNLRELFAVTSTITGIGPESICSRIPDMTPEQITICQQHPDVFTAIEEGYQLAAEECEHQFRFSRWNCSRHGLKSVFGERAIPSTREAAFTHAIISAGVTHRVTRACTMGNLTNCNCDDSRNGQKSPKGWKWGGCSADVSFGEYFADRFMKQSGHNQVVALMNGHNGKAGREVVSDNLVLECKCHGVSASCSTQTCWKRLRSLRAIGDFLRQRYNDIVRISPHMRRSSGGRVATNLVLSTDPKKKPASTQLVYLNDSKDYCLRDETEGILGTEGRQCNISSKGEDGCRMLCCGRGYDTHHVMVDRKCRCKFYWCCFVKCKTCSTREVIHRCK